MKHKSFLLASLLCCAVFSAFSQDITNVVLGPNVIGPSPNASSLGEYAEVPVSLYTGVPETSIPLYQVKSGSLSLPISLSYHSQGVKVEEAASDVGLGWALNAGGAVTRAVRGLPDDYSGSNYNHDPCGSNTNIVYGYFYIPSTTIDWANPINSEVYSVMNAAKGLWDSEPDIFYFNFGSYSGQFVFDKNKVPYLLSQSDLLIQPVFSNSEITGFTITDPGGNKYYFNAAERTTSFAINCVSGGPQGYDPDPYYDYYDNMANSYISGIDYATAFNSSWYLTRVESSTSNSTITLTYTDTREIFMNGLSQSVNRNAVFPNPVPLRIPGERPGGQQCAGLQRS